MKHSRSDRPLFNLYSDDARHRVTSKTVERVGRCSSVKAAIIAGAKRVVDGQWNRCDIYNRYGAHIYSVIRFPKKGVAIVSAPTPLSMHTPVISFEKVREVMAAKREGPHPNVDLLAFMNIPKQGH